MNKELLARSLFHPAHPPSPPASPCVFQVLMLSGDAVVDKELLVTVIRAGHSRVPVHEGNNKQVGGWVGVGTLGACVLLVAAT